jgi:ABC-type multidrug transport system fused ATPase/permease subunit
MKLLKTIYKLLPNSKKRRLYFLFFLVVIGMFLEVLGLGSLIPILAIITSDDLLLNYPFLNPVVDFLGNPSPDKLVLYALILLIIVYSIKALFLVYVSWHQSKFSADLSASLSKNLFLGYLKKPYAFHLNQNSADLIRNVLSEVNFFSSITQSIIILICEFSIMLSLALVLFFMEPLGALIVLIFYILSGYIFHLLSKNKILNWGKLRQFHDGKAYLHLLQGLGGVKDVKLMGNEKYFIDKFNFSNLWKAKLSTKQITIQQVPRVYLEVLGVIGVASLIIIMIIQGKSIDSLLLTLGVFVAAAFRMIPSLNRIMVAIQSIRFAKPVVDLLEREFHSISSQKENEKNNFKNKILFKQSISISNLSYTYPEANKPSLNKISLQINYGDSIGLIGKSGSGKTTLSDLILGLLKPSKGYIKVDGINIYNNIQSWQKQIGYVPQSIYLLDDTLRRNIAFGIPDDLIDENAIQQSIISAQLSEFIDSLDDGLDTMVGERGVRLSGGQKQRIGIARALYNNPPLIVLDEATSSLDNETERNFNKAVEELKGKKTLIIVAHRLSTIENCDKIFKLDNGFISLDKKK